MKLKHLFFSVALTSFLSSYVPYGGHSLQIGNDAPLLTLSSNSKIPNLDILKGKYVVVNFWSPTDPESRLNNKQLADLISSLPPSQIQFVSICTDTDITLQHEIMDADGVPLSINSLSASDIIPDVLMNYQVESGYRSFLIDPFGNLKSISPTSSEIKSVTVS